MEFLLSVCVCVWGWVGGCIGNNGLSVLFITDARNCVVVMSRRCLTVTNFVSACKCFMGVVRCYRA